MTDTNEDDEDGEEERYLSLTAPLRIVFSLALGCVAMLIPVACLSVFSAGVWSMLENIWTLSVLGLNFALFLITIEPLFRLYGKQKNCILILVLMSLVVLPCINFVLLSFISSVIIP